MTILFPGFKARRPNKHVLYGLSIRIAGRMRWITIGSEIEWTPHKARAEAERIRGLKRQNVDIAAERDRRKKASPSLSVAADRFLREHGSRGRVGLARIDVHPPFTRQA
jgi:Arm DNA-binding domain